MSPDRVVDYPLGLRSQGPAFKSPSGRFRATDATSDSEEPVRPKTARRDLSTIDAARPKGATVYRLFKSPSGRSLRSRPNEAHARFARVNRRPDAPFGHARTSPTLTAARVERRPDVSGCNAASVASSRFQRNTATNLRSQRLVGQRIRGHGRASRGPERMSRRRQAVTLLDKMRRTARMRGGTSLTGVVGTGRTGGPGQLVSFRVTDSLAVLEERLDVLLDLAGRLRLVDGVRVQ